MLFPYCLSDGAKLLLPALSSDSFPGFPGPGCRVEFWPFFCYIQPCRAASHDRQQMKFAPKFLPGLVLITFLAVGASIAGAAAARDYQINDRGQTRTFLVALDELHVAGKTAPEKILPALNFENLRGQAETLSRASGKEVRLVLYARGSVRNDFTRRLLTREVLVQLAPGVDAEAVAKAVGAKRSRSFEHIPRHHLFAASDSAGVLALAETLRRTPGVVSAEPQLARLAQKKSLPNDPLFGNQWHLRNIGQNGGTPGMDINVTNVWDRFRGTNIYIGIVDDGLQYTHPDLAPNYDASIDYDWNGVGLGPDLDPYPDVSRDDHGTSVAGLAAARGNNGAGVCGVAYEAKLVGLRLIALAETDADDHDAMLHSNAVIQIKNNSWGATDCYSPTATPTVLEGAGPLMKAALAEGAATGRNGKGVIYTFAGGNGVGFDCQDDVNYDGYANSIYVFAIGALNDLGGQSSYSEPGACLIASAPGGDSFSQWITTTDLLGENGENHTGASDLGDLNYTEYFGGTSAAAPIASGVMALMLQANPNLGYRDVMEILLRSSTKVQPADSDWQTNSAGIAHNHRFGAGLLNAEAAVNLATNWGYLGPVTNISLLQTNLSVAIPDNNPTGVNRLFAFTNVNFRVEHITLTMTAPHSNWGDLAVTVTSPTGMRSRLAETHHPVNTNEWYQAWAFNSVRHWGEKANGTWTVTVADAYPANTGTLNALELKLYGTTPAAVLTSVKTNQSILLNLQAAAPGWTYAIDSASSTTNWTQLTTLTIPPAGSTNYTDTNALLLSRRFYRARLLP